MGCETTKGCFGCGEALDFRLLYLFLLKSAAHCGSLWKTDRTSGLTSGDTKSYTLGYDSFYTIFSSTLDHTRK